MCLQKRGKREGFRWREAKTKQRIHCILILFTMNTKEMFCQLQRRAAARPREEEREAREGAPSADPAGERAQPQVVRDGQEPEEALRGGSQAQGWTSPVYPYHAPVAHKVCGYSDISYCLVGTD